MPHKHLGTSTKGRKKKRRDRGVPLKLSERLKIMVLREGKQTQAIREKARRRNAFGGPVRKRKRKKK